MNRSARTFGFPLAASLALHGVLLLSAAWLMAVVPERARKRPASLLVSYSDVWRYRLGTSEPGTDWKTATDESLDATWHEGRGWIGYGTGVPGTNLDEMRGQCRTLYLRKSFHVSSSIPGADEAVLDIDFDDGFIAWIDGVYVDHDGPPGEVPAEPVWNAVPEVPSHECSFGNNSRDPQPVRSKTLGTVGKLLPPGPHVLSVLLINDSIDSEDAVAKIDLYTRKPVPDDPAAQEPDNASLEEVAVTFVPAEQIKPPPDAVSGVRPQKEQKFIYADGSQKAEDPLQADTAFISSQNMRAASTAAPNANGDPNRISQEGVDIPVFALNSRDFASGNSDPTPPSPPSPADPQQPAPPSSPPPPPAETVKPALAADRPPDPKNMVKTDDPLAPAPADKPKELKPDQTEMRDRPPEPVPLAKAPSPSIRKSRPQDPVAPTTKPSSASKTSISSVKSKSLGAIALRAGEASEDAKDTPEGRYRSVIHERVGTLWNSKLAGVRGLAGAGVVEVEYDIDVKGTVSGVKLVDPGKANAVLEDVCLTAIIKVKLPPPPEEMLRELRDPLSSGKLHCTFTFYRL